MSKDITLITLVFRAKMYDLQKISAVGEKRKRTLRDSSILLRKGFEYNFVCSAEHNFFRCTNF